MERVSITELEDAYVVCRGLGHAWDDNPNGLVDGDLFRVASGVLMLRCARCTTERFDYIGKDMAVFQRYYRYPPRYQSIPGEGTRPNLRGEMFRRSLFIHVYQDKRGKLRAVK